MTTNHLLKLYSSPYVVDEKRRCLFQKKFVTNLFLKLKIRGFKKFSNMKNFFKD